MRAEQLEGVVAIALIFVFIFAERRRPIVKTDKKVHLRLDIIGFFAIFAFGRLSRFSLKEIGETLTSFFETSFSSLHSLYANIPSIPRVILAIIIVDFCLYWIHRGMHNPRFWRFHTWHHSIEQLYWFSGFRASLIHTFLFLTPQVLLIYALGLTRIESISAFTFGIFIQFWQHANFDITLGKAERFIMTPRFHRLHHAKEQYRDKNFGTVLVIWDRIFGTYIDPCKANTKIELGLSNNTVKTVKSAKTIRMILGV